MSELAWKLADYKAAGTEPPARIADNPELTEGEMMSTDEVDEFVKDSIATLRILADKQSPRYTELVMIYQADLAYLAKVGSLDEAEYNELIKAHNLTF